MRVCYRTTEQGERRSCRYEIHNLDTISMKQTFMRFSPKPDASKFAGELCVRELPVPDRENWSLAAWRFVNLSSNPHFERMLQVAIAGRHSTVIYNPETFANESFNAYLLTEMFTRAQITLRSMHESIRAQDFDIHIDFRPYQQLTLHDILKVFPVIPLTSQQIHVREQEFQALNVTRCMAIATMARGAMQHDQWCDELLTTARQRLSLTEQVEQAIWRVAETIALLANSPIIKCEHVAEAISYSQPAIVFEE